MTRDEVRQYLETFWDDRTDTILIPDGLEASFVGVDFSDDLPRAVFSRTKAVAILAQHMSVDDAEEYFSFNVGCAYVGPQGPLWIETP